MLMDGLTDMKLTIAFRTRLACYVLCFENHSADRNLVAVSLLSVVQVKPGWFIRVCL